MRNKKLRLKIQILGEKSIFPPRIDQIPLEKFIFPAENRPNPPGEICFSRRESTFLH
jgi:hypothetical protein